MKCYINANYFNFNVKGTLTDFRGPYFGGALVIFVFTQLV